jgi:hypothetical protein
MVVVRGLLGFLHRPPPISGNAADVWMSMLGWPRRLKTADGSRP